MDGNVDILATAKKHYEESRDAWQGNHDEMLDDLRFLSGEQWPKELLSEREGRPCLTINKLPAFLDQITGDQLQNSPQVKYIPVDGYADKDTADVMTGLLRHIEQQSEADVAYDTGFDSSAACGKGAWRILTDYSDDESFEQEIVIERILNRFSVFTDPLAKKWDHSDGRYMFIVEDVPRSTFEAEYPDADHSQWDKESGSDDWISPDSLRVAEYFYKVSPTGMLYEIEYGDGRRTVTKELPEQDEFNPYIIVNKRKLKEDEIWWCKLIGTQVLEGPRKLPGKYFPIVLVWGKELVLDDKRIFRGAIRHAKDPQRLYNYNRSANAERSALAKPSPYFITPKQIQNHEGMWNNAHRENRYYMLFNPDPQMPGAPQRQLPGTVDTAIQAETLIADQEIHDTTGLQLASMGKRSNEKSGVAIQARQHEGDVATFAFTKNLNRAMKYSAKVILDLIPKIYDTARMIRILGPDGKEKLVRINQEYQEGGGLKAYWLGVGKYDVVSHIGPSYTTLRQEAGDVLMQIQRNLPPEVAVATSPIVVEALDLPGGMVDKFVERVEKLVELQFPGLVEKKPGEQEQPTPEQVAAKQQQEMALQQQQAMLELEIQTKQVQLETEKAKLRNMELKNQKILIDMGKTKQEMVHSEAELEMAMEDREYDREPGVLVAIPAD